jgi:PAS domain S-box-containing protein
MVAVALTRLDVEQAIAPCPPLIGAQDPFLAAVALMTSHPSRCVLVVADGEDRLVGLLTEQDVVNALAQGRVEGAIAAVMTQPVQTLQRSRLTDGLQLWRAFHDSGVDHLPVVDDAGQVLGIVTDASLGQAITLALMAGSPMLSETAEALHRSETTNRSILQAVPDLLLRTRQDGSFIEVLSQGNVRQFFGVEGTVNLVGYTNLPPAVIARKRAFIQQAVTTGELQVFEQQFEVAGESCYEEVRVVPLRQDEALVMVRDITDRKILELALRDSEAKSRAILDIIPDLMFWVSAEGQYLEYVSNRHLGDIVPLSVDPTGQFMVDMLPEGIWQRQMHYIRLALDTQTFQSYEQQIQVGDRWQYEEVRVAPCGEQSVFFMIRDLTERHQAALALQLQADREALIVNLTHQIRQSLDLDQILQTTVTGVRQFLEADRVLIYRFDAAWGGDMIVEAVEAPWRAVLHTTLRDPCFADELVEQYRQGRVSQIDDLHNAELSVCHVELLAQFQVQANLAVPITCDGALWGLLCVHQCRSPRQWQPAEVELLTQLTAQLAIALQQATLYQHLQAELQERQRAEALLRNLAEGTAAVTGADFFSALAQHVAIALDVNAVMVSELVDAAGADAVPAIGSTESSALHHRTLAFWVNGELQPPMTYPILQTSCEVSLRRGGFYCPSGVQNLLPAALDFIAQGMESYLGVALPDATGRAMGVLCLLHTQTIAYPEQTAALLRVFAARAGAELERQRATRALECLNDELEAKVLERTAALQASELRFRRLTENLPGMVYACVSRADGTDQFTYVGPRCQEVFEIDADLLLQTSAHLWERMPPDDRARFRVSAAAAIQSGCSLWNIEHRIMTATGRLKWIQATAQPSRLPNGDILWEGFALDISDRKALELSLQASEAKLHNVLNHAIAAISSFRIYPDMTWEHHYYSPGFEALLGYTPDELIARKRLWLSRVHPADVISVIHPLCENILAGQRTAAYEYRVFHQDGRLRWLAATLTADWDTTAQCWMVTTVNTDISDRKQSEIALQHKTSELQAIFDALPDVYFRLDAESRICDYHCQREDLLYAPPALFLGKQLCEVLPPDLEQRLTAAIAMARQGRSLVTLEYPLLVPAGLHDFEARMQPLGDGQVIVIVRDISDRKRLEAERRQSQQDLQTQKDFLQRVIDSVPSCIFVKDANLRIQIINQAMADLYGTTTAAAVGKLTANFHVNITAEQRQIFHREDTAVLQSGEVLVKQDRLVNPAQEVRWYQTTLKPFFTQLGKAPGMIGNAVDITDRKQAELALSKREAQYRAIVEDQTELISRFLPDGTFCFVNAAFCRYFQVERHEILGQPYIPLLFTTDRDHVLQQVQSLSAENPVMLVENRVIVQGEIRWTQWNNRGLFDAQGQLLEYQSVGRDITAAKQAEAALRDRIERERLLSEMTQNIRQSLDLDQILETTVTEVRRVFNADRALIFQLTSDGAGVVIQESVLPAYAPTTAMYFPEECFPPDCYTHYCAGQPRIVVDVSTDVWADCIQNFMQAFGVQSKIVAPIVQQDEHDRPIVWGLLIIHACAERRVWHTTEAEFLQQISNQVAIAIQQSELYHQLQDTNRHLARATRLKDEFLANMSHELRTPLNAILGLSEALQSPVFGPVNDKQKQFLTTIQASGNHLLALINDILDLAKMEAGKLELTLRSVPIQQLCESSLLLVEQQALQKGVQLRLHLDCPLDSITVDALRIRQVLVNLLNNAVKFTPTGGLVTLSVSLDSPESPEPSPFPGTGAFLETGAAGGDDFNCPTFLYFSVIDTGIGIARADLGKLFQTFVQLDSGLARQYEGTGLGLVLVRRIVHLHGGQVMVDSRLGQGSRFTVALPWPAMMAAAGWDHPAGDVPAGVTPAGDVPAGAASAGAGATAGHSSSAMRHSHLPHSLILLAEDQLDSAEMVACYLESHGYQLLLAKDGQAAIALAQTQLPDLVLMDIQMPGMDGFAAIRQFRADRQLAQVPIIALTALAMPGDREKCLAVGANEYLPKPIRLHQLLETIQRLLWEPTSGAIDATGL